MASFGLAANSVSLLVGALLLITSSAAQYVMPELASQPEPLTYVRANSTVLLGCTVRGSTSALQCGYRRRSADKILFVPNNSVIGPGVRCLSNGIEVQTQLVESASELAEYQFFCKAVTNSKFALIGSPFQVKIIEIQPFSDAGPTRQQKECLKGNKVQIECRPPHSVPPADVTFTVNGAPLTPLDRYRVVRLATGSFALIIGKVLLDDGGGKLYGCLATNPITRQTVYSPVQTELIVQQHIAGFPDAVTARYPETVAAPAPRDLTLMEGDNASYSCITESSPIAEVSYLRDSGRRQLPGSASELREFGLLQFTGIGLADQGSYACRVSYRPDLTSSGHMRDEKKLEVFNIAVKQKLSIVVRPLDVSLDNQDAIGSFVCRLVGNDRRRPIWFNNGRQIDPATSAGFSIEEPSDVGTSRLIVRRFEPSMRGIVQCVAFDSADQWATASATLLLRSETVTSDLPPPPPPPVELASSSALSGSEPATRQLPPVSGALLDRNAPRLSAAAASVGPSGAAGGLPDAEPRTGDAIIVSPPTAEKVGYNMVVNVSWTLEGNEAYISNILYFIVEVREIPQPPSAAALSDAQIGRAEPKNQMKYFFLWHRPSVGKEYRFRLAYKLRDEATERKTAWGKLVRFLDIIDNQPRITDVPSTLQFPLKWDYQSDPSHRVLGFTILLRENGKAGYTTYNVSDGTARQYFIHDRLSPGFTYQAVMFARLAPFAGGDNLRSKLSSSAQFRLGPVDPSLDEGKNSKKSLQYMYIILGCLGGLTLIVVLIVICLCAYCSRRDKSQRIQQPNEAWSNTFTYASQMQPGMTATYKDPAKLINRASLHRHGSLQHQQQQQQLQNSHNNFSLSLLQGGHLAHQQQPQAAVAATYGGYPTVGSHGGYPMEQTSMMLDYYGQQQQQQQQMQHPHMQQASPYQLYQQHGSQQHGSQQQLYLQHGSQQQLYYGQQQQQMLQHQHQQAHGGGTLSKREPPSGGSIHESEPDDFNEQNETLYYRGGSQGPTYGQHMHHQMQPQQQQQQHHPQHHHHHQGGGTFGSGYGGSIQRLGGMQQVMNPGVGGPADNESVYSYFSQHDIYAQTPGGQQQFYMVDGGTQTAAGSQQPQHRHHRRKRRRQPGSAGQRGVGLSGVGGEAGSSAQLGTPPVMRDRSTNTDFQEVDNSLPEEDTLPPPPPPVPQHHHLRGHHGEIYEHPEDLVGMNGGGVAAVPPPPSQHTVGTGTGTGSSSGGGGAGSTIAVGGAAGAAAASAAAGNRESTPTRQGSSSASLHRGGGAGGSSRYGGSANSVSSSSLPRGRAFSPQPGLHQQQQQQQLPPPPPGVPKMRSITDYAIPSGQFGGLAGHHHLQQQQQQQQQQQHDIGAPGAPPPYPPGSGNPSGLHLPYQQHQQLQQQQQQRSARRGDYPV